MKNKYLQYLQEIYFKEKQQTIQIESKMNNKHNALESPIFDHYRKNEQRIKQAIQFLNENDFYVYKKTAVDYEKL